VLCVENVAVIAATPLLCEATRVRQDLWRKPAELSGKGHVVGVDLVNMSTPWCKVPDVAPGVSAPRVWLTSAATIEV